MKTMKYTIEADHTGLRTQQLEIYATECRTSFPTGTPQHTKIIIV